jgi:transcriptional regulator with XRE-family HTH domain
MAKPKQQIQQADIVVRFGQRLREVRLERSLTQAELAERAQVSVNYIGRLEKGSTTPGVDLVDRLAAALGTTVADLLPAAESGDPVAALKERARKLFEGLMKTEDRATLLLLTQLLAHLSETANR